MKTKHQWTPQQVRALKSSIRHWEEICASDTPELALRQMGAKNCPCCRLWNVGWGGGCIGCPVSSFAGVPYCNGTPYRAASLSAGCRVSRWRSRCRAELNFLKRVLRAGVKKATAAKTSK